jgi:hypothetical protein
LIELRSHNFGVFVIDGYDLFPVWKSALGGNRSFRDSSLIFTVIGRDWLSKWMGIFTTCSKRKIRGKNRRYPRWSLRVVRFRNDEIVRKLSTVVRNIRELVSML